MKTKIIIAAVVIIVALLAILYGTQRAEAPADLATHTFISETEESIEVRFDNENDTAIMTGAGYEDLVFTRAISASGARYENEVNNLILWNKGDEISLYAGDAMIFSGTTGIHDETLPLETTAWSWQYTELQGGERTEAPTGDLFVLTFAGDGNFGSTTDCNSLGGSYVMEGEVLSIGEIMMTKMYCEGSMEGVYAEQLGLVNSYMIAGDTLRLNLNRDYGVMVFKVK